MISLLLNILFIVTFLFSGYLVQAIKKFVSVTIKLICKLLALFGIKIKVREHNYRVSDEFKKTYKDIKTVKLSKKNIKQESSIDWVGLILFIIAGLLYLFNLKVITGNAISNWMYSWVSQIPLVGKLVADEIAMNTFYTAGVFAVLTFALTKIYNRWKETKPQRVEKKEALLKARAIEIMSSKELLDSAKDKDEAKEKSLK